MTVRAVLLGLLAAALVCGFCYFNDFVMHQTFLVGNYMPISVFGGLLVFLLLFNPLLWWVWKRLALSGRELAVIVALTLAACYVPGRGLMHYFFTFMMLPHHYARTDPGWKKHKIVDLAPKRMLAGVPPPYRESDLLDAPRLCARLLEAADDPEPSPVGQVWTLLPDDVRATAADVVSDPAADQRHRAAVLDALGDILPRRDFYREEDFGEESLPDDARALLRRGVAALSDEEIGFLNRSLLSGAYPGLVAARELDGPARLTADDISDWPRFCDRLQRQGTARRRSPGKRLWELLPDGAREAVGAVVEASKVVAKRRERLVAALNRLVGMGDLYQQQPFAGLDLPAGAEELLEQDALSRDEVAMLNRHTLDATFPEALRSHGASEDRALNGFVQGLGVGSRHVTVDQIPWHAWWRALGFWVPLLLAFSFAMVGLALVVHRQWSHHEQMPYPIVTFANALLPREGEVRGGVFRNKLFWIGGGIVLLIHLNNYACTWWPRYLVPIQRTFDFRSLTPLIPPLQRAGDWALMNPTLYFTAIGFAFFLATDVSLSLGLAAYVYALALGILMGYGVSVEGGGFISLNIRTFLFGGAYFGMFLVLLYTGRHYYVNVVKRAAFLGGKDEVEARSAWGARVFLLGGAAFALQLVLVGLPWYLAAIYTAGATVIFTVISRVVSETGVFFIHAYHFPCVMLWGFLGARTLGPRAMLIMFMVTSLLLIDPREAVMPFMTQAFKLVDENRVKLGRTAWWSGVALCVGFLVAVPVTLYWLYDYGSGRVADGWTRNVPRMSFDATVRVVEKLEAQGCLEEAGKQSGMAWLRSLSPNKECVAAFGIAMGLVLAFAAARLRFPRWPLHPVMFLILGTFQSRTLAFSFLVGCAIKVLVTKYGGASAYQKLKPLMIGVIAGDMLGGLTPMVIGAIYWWLTGEPPEQFKVLPS